MKYTTTNSCNKKGSKIAELGFHRENRPILDYGDDWNCAVETGDWFHLPKYKLNQIRFELLHSHGKLADYVFGNIPTGIILPHSLYRSEDHGCLSCTTHD